MNNPYNVIEDFEHCRPDLVDTVVDYKNLGGYELQVEFEKAIGIFSGMYKTIRWLPKDPNDMTDGQRLREFGERLRHIMFVKRVSQVELARRTGISNALLSDYVNCKHKPSFANACKICDALDCSMDDLRYTT